MQTSILFSRLVFILGMFSCLFVCGQKNTKSPAVINLNQIVVEATIGGLQKTIKEGKCSCEQIVDAYLKRIEAYDQSTKLNSIILTNPNALITARALDKEWQRTKKMRPLFCVPIIVKDNYNTAGIQTTAGSLAMKGFVPVKDATTVKKVIDAYKSIENLD